MGRSWGLCWRSGAALGAVVGGPGPLLGPLLAVLGRSWAYVPGPRPQGLCWRSWAVLGRTSELKSGFDRLDVSFDFVFYNVRVSSHPHACDI